MGVIASDLNCDGDEPDFQMCPGQTYGSPTCNGGTMAYVHCSMYFQLVNIVLLMVKIRNDLVACLLLFHKFPASHII